MPPSFAALSLPAPQVSLEDAAKLAGEHFGVSGPVRDLGSNQEANVLVRDAAGDAVLKVANPAFALEELELQNAVMLHLASVDLPVQVPRPLAALDGSLVVRAEVGGVPTHLRLLTYLPGDVLVEQRHLADVVLQDVGRVAAHLAAALTDVDHRGADRVLQWDAQHSLEVVEGLAPAVPDPAGRARVQALVEAAMTRLDAVRHDLPTQLIHGDLADYNLLSRRGPDGRPQVSGVIDFGDVVRTWRASDLTTAVTATLWREGRSPLLDLVAAAVGYHRVLPLTEAEVVALWPLVLARAAVLAVSVEHQVSEDPHNPTAASERDLVWRVVDRVAQVPVPLAEEALRRALGFDVGEAGRRARSWAARLVSGSLVSPAPTRLLDLSVTSPDLVDGTWEQPGAVAALAGTDRAVLRHGEARLVDVPADSRTEPASVSLGAHLLLPVGTEVRAVEPAMVVQARPDGLVLRDPAGLDVHLGGLQPADGVRLGTTVEPGTALGSVRTPMGDWPAHLHVQVVADPGLIPPARSVPSLAPAWLTLCPDPARLLGLASTSAPPDPVDNVVHRRDEVVAPVQEHYYRHPPRIERGWRHHLFDTRGRAYVDMVNNVTVLGHSHPAVTRAALRQYRLLNTNSRFVYAAMVELAERVVALLPEPLDTVFFVNSGSEAVDLALRLTRTATGRRDVIALRGGYHGWTTATDEVSTSLQDNPQAVHTRPDWVHLAAMPNLYRGEHRGPDAADRYAADVQARIDVMAEGGRAPAAFLAEPLSGNAGGVELPPGYLQRAYAAVRSAGGLCIADEVQVGYGRLGGTFWGFEEHGVVPDVVTMAKAAGNGHPLGFVVTRRDVAEAFGSQGSFFSSVGGSPVSCAVGLAVLDTLEAEGLQRNAATVGAHLRRRLDALAAEHPLIGTVHGHGLYQGVELVRDPGSQEPATPEAAAVCERLLDLGVVCQPTGDYSNVLKVKPPLCITPTSADLFVDALDQTLREGW